MVNNEEEVKKAFNRFLTQTAREQNCKDDEIAVIISDYLKDTYYF